MGENKFFEVFPTLKLKEDARAAFAEAVITGMVMNSAHTCVKIYTKFSRLIGREMISAAEGEIKRQIRPFFSMEVKIIERFELSELYTAPVIIEEYDDSILYELSHKNMLEYQIYKNAEKNADDCRLTLTVKDDFVTHRYAEELKETLCDMMLNRFGIQTDIEFVYKEKEESRYSREAEHKLNQIVAEISAKAGERAKTQNKTGETETQDKPEKTENVASKPAKPVTDNSTRHVQKSGDNNFFKNGYRKPAKMSDNPDVIYGRDFDDDVITLETVVQEMGEITFRGCILSTDKRELKSRVKKFDNGDNQDDAARKFLFMFDVTDYTDSITVKMFLMSEQLEEIESKLKKGAFIKVKGVTTVDKFSGELTIGSVAGIKKTDDFRVKRTDMSLEKRVELHCHTKMSELDAVSNPGDIVKQACDWGQPAIAITDHGVVQGFTDAFHTKLSNSDFKIIYGVEAYIVDDLKKIIDNPKGQNFDDTYVIFDLETTGLSPVNDRIIEIGAVKMQGMKFVDSFSCFVNPQIPIPFKTENLTGINDIMVRDAETIKEVLPKFLDFCGDAVLVAHNAGFDTGFIKEKADKLLGKKPDFTIVDTVALSRALLPQLGKFTLDHVAKVLGVPPFNHHRAVDDAEACADIFVELIKKLQARGINELDAVNEIDEFNLNAIQKAKTYHAIILASSEEGRVNLYRLISMSHLTYFHKRPRIPKSEIQKHRNGLILGSACSAGELFQAILNRESDDEIARIIDFYDYLEIQPIGNNEYMLADEKISQVTGEADLQNLNREIVMLGEKFNKPVVATCDVHFLNPEDEIYRRIIKAGQGFDDADDQAPLYLRTTEEMLREFEYLGEEKAYEVVVTNTRKISDMCDRIEPVRPDKCPPKIPHSDDMLREICYNNAHKMYGPNLPKIVQDRLDKELTSIISNGYSVMYIIAQKLVWKSNEDGYLVGSRGSVGSSFAATMAGITEVNPLSPHYLCPNCYYCDFDSPEVKEFAGGAGCDMPDKMCPQCGTKLRKEGFDIPFETFLGFNGDKEPDIDLNFSGEYQAKAHAYVEVIFGEGQTFKAGTVGTLADKTMYGYVKKYFEEKHEPKRNCEINRIVQGGVGVKRSTGQHPGGIIVLPYGEDINSFTPVQHPANDMTSNIVTTHFDYHSIDHNLLKLDILGHDDPTMIRMLQDLTGIDPQTIPLDSPEVMSLFQSTEALKISPKDIGGTKLGCLGIPEFGTDFAMQMLIDTKPKHFSDLVRIAGLAHGTDVWLGNAQTLIESGQATISTAICTRDDIMVYLINKGIEAGTAFKIMENVRKGKVAKKGCDKWPEWKQLMLDHDVPEWYIWSCEKIMYMFPKAHAAAYVMMAWRIAYCKVFYPLQYYAAYYSIRADNFSYELMCFGKEKLDYFIADYKKRSDYLSQKEEGQLKDMRLVQEMYARGFEFMPIDLYKSHSRNFQIIDGKLLPPFKSIDGLGEAAADGIYEAAKNGPFKSKEDFIKRSKVPKTSAALMADLGILEGLPESNQLSLFDFTD
ncbi:MAG: PolC-type DNA polymerase III [Butyrivibrio sp.]